MIVECYPDGNKKSECNYINNKKHGLCVYYYANGNKSSECMYKNDVVDGLYIDYHFNGKIRYKYTYKNGLRDGICIGYNWTGFKEFEYNYVLDICHGICIDFYNDGTKKSEKYFVNDDNYSSITEYYENGNLKRKASFTLETKYQDKISSCTKYHENGKKSCEINNYIDGKDEGIHIYYNDHEIKIHEDLYIEGILTVRKYYDSNKIIRKQKKYDYAHLIEGSITICYYINNKVKCFQKDIRYEIPFSLEYYKSGYIKDFYKNKKVFFY